MPWCSRCASTALLMTRSSSGLGAESAPPSLPSSPAQLLRAASLRPSLGPGSTSSARRCRSACGGGAPPLAAVAAAVHSSRSVCSAAWASSAWREVCAGAGGQRSVHVRVRLLEGWGTG
eukprot:365850-Chlamydomonas_euryale.AAC.8